MKTNVKIEMTDAERCALADIIDGKQSKRLATRLEIIALCRRHIFGLTDSTPASELSEKRDVLSRQSVNPLYVPDPADVPLMAQPNNPGYVRGWNSVKYGQTDIFGRNK